MRSVCDGNPSTVSAAAGAFAKAAITAAAVTAFTLAASSAFAQTLPTSQPPAAAPPPAAPAAPAAAPVAPAAAPAYTLNGLLDAYYEYNFNNPSYSKSGVGTAVNGPGERNFDYKDNQFALGLAELNVVKSASDTSRAGFKVTLAYGPTANLLTAAKDADNLNVLQAYGTYLLPVGGKDLTLDAGKFVTFLGQEVIEPSANWNYSRSDLFQYFIPVYHAGVRAAFPLSPTTTVTGFIVNGWNNVSYDTNDNKGYGLSFAFNPSPKWSLLLNGLTSNEPAGLTDQPKTVLEPILTWNFSPTLTGVLDANFDFGKGTLASSPAKPDSTWNASGVAGYLHFGFKSGNSLTLRGEYVDDDKGFLYGTNGKQDGGEGTLTYSLKSANFANAETRFEYRYDWLKQAGFFEDKDGNLSKKNQSTLSVSEMFTF